MTDQVRAALERLLIDIDDLVTESHGVSGLDKNLDPTPWSELLEGGEYQEWLGDAITQARVALATCKRIVAEPTDEELLELTKSWPVTTASRHDLSGCPEVPLYSVFADDVTDFARAVLARWGQRESGSPAVAAVDVEELVAALDQDGHHLVEVALARECSKTWGLANRVVRAAALLRQLAAQAQPLQPADPIRDAAERLLQQLELGRTDPSCPLQLEQAENNLRAALAFASPQHVVAPKNDSCPGCEGSPSTSNNPCAVCGAIRPQEFQ